MCWAVLVNLCLFANQQKLEEIMADADEASGSAVMVLRARMLFLVFSLYWVWQFVSNTVHVTVAGAFASWYFFGSRASSVVLSSLRRGIWSAGSVCLGSLLVAILQLLRLLAGGDGDGRGRNCVAQMVRRLHPSSHPLPATSSPVSYPTNLYPSYSTHLPPYQPRCSPASSRSSSSSTSAPAGPHHPTHPTPIRPAPSPQPPPPQTHPTPSSPAHP